MLVFPNIYVLFLADSGVARKGAPISLAESLVVKCSDTRTISGRASIQAILDEIGRSESDSTTGKVKKGGVASFFAPELSGGLVGDTSAIEILTDIYDYKPKYKEHLRGRGNSEIGRIVFSLFAASNETLLKSVYDTRAIYGGLLARTFVVKPDEFRPGQSLTKIPDTTKSYEVLVHRLREIIQLVKGEVSTTPEAAEEYESWYIPFRESYRHRTDTSGVVSRIHTSVFKLAMILAANDLTTVIQKKHVEEAIYESMALLPNYNSLTLASGNGDLSGAGAIFLQDLMEAKDFCLTRKQILRARWHEFDAEMLDKLASTLEQAGIIQTSTKGNEIAYRLTDKALTSAGAK